MKKYENTYCSIVFYFTLAFAIYTLFGRVALLHALVEGPVNSLLYVGAAGLGLLLVFVDLLFYRRFAKMSYYVIYIAFIVCTAISSALNYKYGISSNASTIGWLVVQMGLFATMGQHFTDDIYKKWLKYFSIIGGFIWAIAAAGSVYQFFFVKGYKVFLNERNIRQSFYDNRLFGLFIDPNLGAFVGFIFILAMLYLIHLYKNKLVKILCITNIVIQVIYIILSGSRSTEVCMVVSLSYLFIYLLNKRFEKQENVSVIKKAACYVAIPIACTVVILFAFQGAKNGAASLAHITSPELHKDVNELERTDIEDDATNNRSDIWKGYLELAKDKPLFGLSPRNAWEYADKVHPDSYLANHHYDVHNAYIAVLAGTGVIGFILLAIMMFFIVKTIIPRLFDTKKMTPQYFAALQLIINIAVFICFYPGIFFTSGIDTVLFWPAIGFAVAEAKKLHLPFMKK